MSRINTNVQSLLARRILNTNIAAQNQALERLSTGLRINRGKDDPAGLIASETLRNAQVAIGAAIDNSHRADSVLAVAEGSLQEISSLLLELENLIDRSASEAGLSSEEVAANQLQIDAILDSINRIADSTAFGDRKLINGSLEFTISGTTNSDQRISAIQINSAKLAAGTTRTVSVDVLAASEFAYISAVAPGSGGATSGTLTIEIQGIHGTEVMSFASGTTAATMATAINASSDLTGVSAVVSGAGGALIMTSTTFGSDAFVSVQVLSGSVSTDTEFDEGVDGTVTINGRNATVKGLTATVSSTSLSAELILAEDFARMAAGVGTSASFEITGGGAIFAISPDLGLAGQASLGLQAVSTGSLGNGVDGFLSSLGTGQTNSLDNKNYANAQRTVRAAINQVSSLRGRIGAFQKNTLQTNINSLAVALENITAAESAIRDADFAVETSALTRAQILVSSSTATLQLANAAPQNVLALLG
ncbi:MAG: flagellin [Planctomycetes bacterium]|nr:flagellin [Planctomycetota bacterium]